MGAPERGPSGRPAAPALDRDREVVERAHEALRGDRRLGDLHAGVTLSFSDGTLTLEGEAKDIRDKKRALHRAAATAGVDWVIDRLRVRPAEPMEDGATLDHVCDALQEEPALGECAIIRVTKGRDETRRDPPDRRGELRVSVEDGVVTLDGELPTREHKRLAAVLAWWVPGSRDVVDGMGVISREEDSDEELADAVRLVLEKDPFVDATQLRVSAERGKVTLEGFVPAESEREMAEYDAWYVLGVDEVVDRIEVGTA